MGATATQSPLIFSVVNQYLKHDSEKRAIVMVSASPTTNVTITML
jgi:hypothetical protein